MTVVRADGVTLLSARETSPGTPGTTFMTLQPNPGGIVDLRAQMEAITRKVLSKYLTPEAGDNVGLVLSPKITQDLNKDLTDQFAGDWLRCVPKHGSTQGQSLYRPTAVTATGYTVPSLGALPNGALVSAKGFLTGANNGLKLLAGTSVGTEIKTTGLVVEAAPPSNATVGFAGYQGAAGDITIDVNGDIVTTALDCTTLGLVGGQVIKIGDLTSGAAFGFATALYNGCAVVDPARAVTATKIPLRQRTWTVGAADNGAAKTIRLLYSRFYRNVPLDHADYLESTTALEMEQPGAGTAGVSSFRYGKGLAHKLLELDAPLKSKIVATMSFVGMDCPDPVLAAGRLAGASTARTPMAATMLDTSTDMKFIRLSSAANNTDLASEVNSWKLAIDTNVKPKEQQGVFGAAAHIHGDLVPMLTVNAYFTTDDIPKAIRDNRECQFLAVIANGEFGIALNIPAMKLRGGAESFAAGDAVMVEFEIPAHRELLTNIVASMSVFEYYG